MGVLSLAILTRFKIWKILKSQNVTSKMTLSGLQQRESTTVWKTKSKKCPKSSSFSLTKETTSSMLFSLKIVLSVHSFDKYIIFIHYKLRSWLHDIWPQLTPYLKWDLKWPHRLWAIVDIWPRMTPSLKSDPKWPIIWNQAQYDPLFQIWSRMTPHLKSDPKFLALVHRVEEVSKATREGRINAIRVVLRWFFFNSATIRIFGIFWKLRFDLDRFMCPFRLLSHLIRRPLRYHTSLKTGFLQMSNLRLSAGF